MTRRRDPTALLRSSVRAAVLVALAGCPAGADAPVGPDASARTPIASSASSANAASAASPAPAATIAPATGAAASTPAVAEPPEPADAPRFNVNLDAASGADLLQALAEMARRPVAVEPEVERLLACAKISARSPEPMTLRQTLRALSEPLAREGLALRSVEAGLVMERAAGTAIGTSCHAARRTYLAQPRSSASEADAPWAGVRAISATERALTKAARAQIVDGLARALEDGHIRIVAEPSGGGLRVFGVRARSLFDALGLQNGDRVVSFGAGRGASAADALAALASARSESTGVLVVMRRDERLELVYRVEP